MCCVVRIVLCVKTDFWNRFWYVINHNMCSYIAINRCFPDSTDACELTQRSPYVGAPVAPPPPPSRGHGPSSGFGPSGGRQLSNQIPAFDIDLDELIRKQKLKSPQKFLTEGRRDSLSECTSNTIDGVRLCELQYVH